MEITNQLLKAYCFKCKTKTEMEQTREVVFDTPRGLRRMMKGVCSVCGGKTTRILPKRKEGKAGNLEGE